MSTAVEEKEKVKSEHLEKREFWWWAEKARSPRLDYLRKAIWAKTTRGSAYLPGVKVGTAATYLATEVFKEADPMEPWVLTKARAFEAIFTKIPIFIIDQSRVVGYQGDAPHKINLIPWASYMGNEDYYNDRSGYYDEEERPQLKEAMDFWKSRTLQAKAERYLTTKERMVTSMGYTLWGNRAISGFDYVTLQPDWLYKYGLEGIIKQIDNNLAEANKKLHEGIPDGEEAFEILPKIDQWKAMKICLEAVIKWARRYSRLAKILAENLETDPERKKELLKISETCYKVPAQPPEHFWEVVQFDLFMSLCYRYEWCSGGAWPCRYDYHQWPYYEKDVIKEKNMTREEAVEYCSELRLRCWDGAMSTVFRLGRESAQGGLILVWTLGGVKEDGSDACNDLTDCYLESARLVRTSDPSIGFRYHPNARVETLRQVFECIRHGLGYPSIRNDTVLIPNQMYWFGQPLNEARRWIHQACMSPSPDTKMGAPHFRYPGTITSGGVKTVELALFNGWDPISKMQMGIKTGDAAKFETFEEFYSAWLEQHKYQMYLGVRVDNIIRWVVATQHQRPLVSSLFERCVESGQDSDMCRERSSPWFTHFGFSEYGDCLAGVKKLIYDDKKYTMAQLLEALRANWEGYEEMRMDFVKVPKWGNDDDYADQIYVRGMRDIAKISWETKDRCGQPRPILPENIAAYVTSSTRIGALPNGRRWGDTMYDGGCSPGAGLDKKGPTAVLRSVAKFDHTTDFRANLLNQRLSPVQLAGEKGFEFWLNYIKSWHDLGINHVQFNMIDNETLYAAQKEPEKYPELIVRVAGYSAHFVGLNKKTQDTIIARTVQTLGS